MDETAYLLRSPANEAFLAESIAELERGEVVHTIPDPNSGGWIRPEN
ncbi:type II toxin-antitoxin system Phd/YefM family antitoxin [Rhodococcus xishaensis]|nr:hypothetical protein [Rhodococcus xishaensis]